MEVAFSNAARRGRLRPDELVKRLKRGSSAALRPEVAGVVGLYTAVAGVVVVVEPVTLAVVAAGGIHLTDRAVA